MKPQMKSLVQPLSKLLSPLARPSKNAHCSSVDLLEAHGFIHQVNSGIYDLLPLGLRVQKKISTIIRKHLHEAGCTELELSTLVNPRIWHASGRLQQGSNNSEFCFTENKQFLLAPTAEEQVTTLVGSVSYRQLPLRLYQISRKFRNELRPRGGLLRTREFLMKDLYTFDENKELAGKSYERISHAYNSIFKEIGIPYVVAEAASGDMGGDLSHEYHFMSESGEDTVVNCPSCGYVANTEKAQSKAEDGTITSNVQPGDSCAHCDSALKFSRCIEIGHTFFLGDRYSKPLKALVSTQDGNNTPIQMGCYGIGVTRIIGAVAEKCMDQYGLIWPTSIAPFQCVVVSKDIASSKQLSEEIALHGIEVTYDDRTHQIGQAMSAARQSGIPLTIVLGRSWEHEGLIEILPRVGNSVKSSRDDLPNKLKELIGQAKLLESLEKYCHIM